MEKVKIVVRVTMDIDLEIPVDMDEEYALEQLLATWTIPDSSEPIDVLQVNHVDSIIVENGGNNGI